VVSNACQEPLPAGPMGDPRVHRVHLERPRGFSEANNVGVRWAVENLGEPDHYLFLNNDTEVDPGALATLTAAVEARPECGVAGPCLRILGAEEHLNSLGLNVSVVGETWDEGIGRSLDEYGSMPGCREVLAVTGSALMMRREAYEQAGGWTDFYQYYLEDIDLCLKARSHGWSVVHQPEAVVYHAVSATAGQTSDFKRRLIWRNRFLLIACHWPWSLMLRKILGILAREAAVYLRRRRSGAHDDARLQAAAWRGALRQLPRALALRRRHGQETGWARFLVPAGSVPVIRLPVVAPQPEEAGSEGAAS